MIPLPLANILHHKLRSALSALGVAIGVGMLVTLAGLSRGSLEEVGDRWSAVDADLIVYPAYWGDNITTATGGGLNDGDARLVGELAVAGQPAVECVVPVFLYRVSVGDSEHNLVGVSPQDLPRVMGGHGVLPGGRVFDPEGAFTRWINQRQAAGGDISQSELAEHGGLEVVIDTRLARSAKLAVGDKVLIAAHHFTVVGIVPEGALARILLPRATAEYLVNGRLGRFTLLFVKLKPHLAPGGAIEQVRQTKHLTAVPLDEYRGMLQARFGVMYVYVDAVNAITLIVSFLFILVTLYTMVIQRQREIAILKSMGATRTFILRQVLGESLLLTGCGALAGIALSFAAAAAIEWLRPLLTVTITWHWIVVAALAALAGGTLAAVYPAWVATRLDVVEALSLE